MLKVNEIFKSIQGEGKDVGKPTIFIRLAGCNLRCNFCDTKYAYNEYKLMTHDEIMEKVYKLSQDKIRRICITGGEPLLQKPIYKLIDRLIREKFVVSIETNGSVDISRLAEKNVIIKMDYKLPSSGMEHKMIKENINFLREHDELKFVVGDMKDYKRMKEILAEFSPLRCEVIVQPVWESDSWKEIAERILEDSLNVRFNIQLHKIIWGDVRGR